MMMVVVVLRKFGFMLNRYFEPQMNESEPRLESCFSREMTKEFFIIRFAVNIEY